VRILLFGASGQVGFELRGPLATIGELTALDRADCDVTDHQAVQAAVGAAKPHLIVNASAYNAVDRAEEEPDRCRQVNTDAVRHLGELALKMRAGLIHMSTDYVFDGKAGRPYREDDEPAPLGVYAKSKRAGEKALADLGAPAIVLRTAWVYSRRQGFLHRMLELAKESEHLSVADDQKSSPTFARDLAAAIAMIAFEGRDGPHDALTEWQGVYHLAGSGVASRFELVQEALAWARPPLACRVVQASVADFPGHALRPRMSALDCSRAEERFGLRLPDWRDGVRRAMES
jgi:dTDP-4-dehydrorhamnose reductase